MELFARKMSCLTNKLKMILNKISLIIKLNFSLEHEHYDDDERDLNENKFKVIFIAKQIILVNIKQEIVYLKF